MNIRDLFTNLDRSAIEKWCRAQTQVAYVGDHRALCRVLGKYLMYVDTRDLSLAPHMMMNGFWEMWVTQAIVDYVKPGMRCIDVGANCGYYTLLLADLVGESGKVFAYEPQERVFELLKQTGRVNGGAHVFVSSNAVSNSLGECLLYSSETLLGSAALEHTEDLNWTGKVVMAAPLDALFCEQGQDDQLPIDFVKIDVQGHEMQVLAGMLRLIGRSPKIAIAMEFSPSEHEEPIVALAQIQSAGLRIQTIGTDGQVRPISLEDAAKADTGDHRMLWLTREA
jgi:FkbM family methyltransferase